MAKVTIHIPSRTFVVAGTRDDSTEDLLELSKTLRSFHADPSASVVCFDDTHEVVVLGD